MNILKNLTLLFLISIFATGCSTKIIQVKIPEPAKTEIVKGYVKIEKINDLRKFEKSPKSPSTPSIEGDLIDNKELTDKIIGRMRHGLYHRALWNYTIDGKDNIYDVCRNIVTGSFASAGYVTVSNGEEGYDKAIPITVDILQFWAWMQPKFNIDLNFDGELHIHSLDPGKSIDINAKGKHNFSTGFAGGGAWNKIVKKGIIDLDKNLVLKLKNTEK